VAPDDVWRSGLETGHGREERREVVTSGEIDWVAGQEAWSDIKTIIRYRCWRTENGETAVTEHYYISNLAASAGKFGKKILGPWSIENQLHWILDICFREDACRVRKDGGVENLNVKRKMVVCRFLRTTAVSEKRLSVHWKMPRAALNDEFLYEVLFGKRSLQPQK
jgi:hypothetical protein